ncbi:MAG: hypothetical protein QGG40_05375 [Myxococcota bacterium]|jgi:glycerol-3-phosphate dehydrogenase (NAD(P)+)|nr:hypothetical protein [Myxococcota bacterium]
MIVGILGGGAWGRALATLTAEAGHEPRIGYRKRPPGGFPGSPNLPAIVSEAELVLVAVPASGVREVIERSRPGAGSRVVLASRGIEPDTGKWLSSIVLEQTPCRQVGAIAGPAMAAEVLRHRPSALVVASPFESLRRLAQDALHSSLCRVYTSPDLLGVELSGAVVGVLAMVVGITQSLDIGVSIRGAVVTRGIAELTRLGEALGARVQTFAGLAGIGDLISCASHPDHPWYHTGLELGAQRGCDPRFVQETQAVVALGRRQGIDLPLAQAALSIATGELDPRLAIDLLMRRDPRGE